MKLIDLKVSLDQLMLDPNNFRLDYDLEPKNYKDSQIISQQDNTQKSLTHESLGVLRDSIIENGFLEMDRIVVRELKVKRNPPVYLVVEGNRRAAAFKSIIEDYSKGDLDVSDELINKSKAINVVCIDGTPKEIYEFAAGLMGIRHVAGPKDWKGHQAARLIDELHNKGKTLSQIGALLGMTAINAGRRLRGYRAFQQMKKDKKYGKFTESNHYALLLEFLAPKKAGRDWLQWDDEEHKFKNKKNLERLYSAITSDKGKDPEIKNPTTARLFLKYLEIPKYKRMIEEGTLISEMPSIVENSIKQLQDFKYLLEDIRERKLTTEERDLLIKIRSILKEILS